MLIDISITSFRNHKDTKAPLAKQVIIIGPNASGKTNLLEAIFLGIEGVGFRGVDKELISSNNNWARVDLEKDRMIRTVKLELGPSGRLTKSFEIDGVKKTQKDYIRGGAAVLFEPNELRMLTGPPDLRRSWMDALISRIDTSYKEILERYRRALSQRNSLLKQDAPDDQFFVWELKLGEYGEQITKQRQRLARDIDTPLSKLYTSISDNNESIKFIYNTPSESYASWLIGKLSSNRERDKLIGFTPNGPHRDDFQIQKNGTNISLDGSRGELRSMVLCLKFYELETIEKELNIKPVLLLDDVFSELDESRRHALLNVTKNYQSVFTSTDKPSSTDKESQIIELG